MEYVQIESLECGPGANPANFDVLYEGCACLGPCTADSGCTCLLYRKDIFVNQNFIKNVEDPLPILECSTRCSCSSFPYNCNNRCVQFGNSLSFEVFNAGKKGFGLRCVEQIEKGRFVIEYVGEVIGEDEVVRRQTDVNYVLTIKEVFQDHTEVTYIDPSLRGNLSRFINHSCSPNLAIVLVRCGTPQVHVGLFALRDIPAYEELTYNYGDITSEFNLKKCFCGTTFCRLYLPTARTAIS
ncbi:unnamed protein product [Thelazia callipaeda]|uniref:Histone-lysine N-methyltransferase SETMAR n=1 Tax=Thelazia callipaeda TaxID=103827 RepID=A0A0N5D579_THECL|nr:unnamed protein product [Thelazia callipaeda]